MSVIIEVNNLSKVYVTRKREKNGSLLKWMFQKECIKNYALNGVNFNIEEGALVGLIGANGAGKSTTIKILTGILNPTKGYVKVYGKNPMTHRKSNSLKFGLMMGQRSQLWWDLPAIESFELYRRMYGVSRSDFDNMMELYNQLLELDGFVDKPVRQLSFGQRMRCELGVTFLHKPSVIFLDEPTIGIDILAKERILSFIRYVNKEWKSTVILTTHDISDMEKVTDRALILDAGKLIYDGSFSKLKKLESARQIDVEFTEKVGEITIPNVEITRSSAYKATIVLDRNKDSVANIMAGILNNYPVQDITLQSPDIESIVRKIYGNGCTEGAGK